MNKITSLYFCVLVNISAEERLASLIKKLRADKSQRHFAKLIGVSYAAVRSWEESESMPGLKSLEKIADYSNQTIEELLEYLKDEGKDKSKILKFPQTKFAEDLFPQIKNLTRKEKSKLAQFLIEELAK